MSWLNKQWSKLDFWDKEENERQKQQFAKPTPQTKPAVQKITNDTPGFQWSNNSLTRGLGRGFDQLNPLDNNRTWQQTIPTTSQSVRQEVKRIVNTPSTPKNYWNNGIGKAINTGIAGTMRGAAGIAQDTGGLYDLLTPGNGNNRLTTYFKDRGAMWDAKAKQADVDGVGYHLAQVPINVAGYATPGKVSKGIGLADKIADISTATSKIANKVPVIANIADKIDDTAKYGKLVPRVIAKATQSMATPSGIANISVDALQNAGQRTSRGQDNSKLTALSDIAMSAGMQGLFDVGLQGLSGAANAGEKYIAAPASRLINRTKSEVATGLNTLNRGKDRYQSGTRLVAISPENSRMIVSPEDAGRVIKENLGELLDKAKHTQDNLNNKEGGFIDLGAIKDDLGKVVKKPTDIKAEVPTKVPRGNIEEQVAKGENTPLETAPVKSIGQLQATSRLPKDKKLRELETVKKQIIDAETESIMATKPERNLIKETLRHGGISSSAYETLPKGVKRKTGFSADELAQEMGFTDEDAYIEALQNYATHQNRKLTKTQAREMAIERLESGKSDYSGDLQEILKEIETRNLELDQLGATKITPNKPSQKMTEAEFNSLLDTAEAQNPNLKTKKAVEIATKPKREQQLKAVMEGDLETSNKLRQEIAEVKDGTLKSAPDMNKVFDNEDLGKVELKDIKGRANKQTKQKFMTRVNEYLGEKQAGRFRATDSARTFNEQFGDLTDAQKLQVIEGADNPELRTTDNRVNQAIDALHKEYIGHPLLLHKLHQ